MSYETVAAIRVPSELMSAPSNCRFLKLLSALLVPSFHVAPESEDVKRPPPVLARRILVHVKSQAAPLKSFDFQSKAPRFMAVRVPPRGPIRGVPNRFAMIIFVPSPLIAPAQPPPPGSETCVQVSPELVE